MDKAQCQEEGKQIREKQMETENTAELQKLEAKPDVARTCHLHGVDQSFPL